MHEDGPIRLCCFQRHWSIQCSDGLVLCCLCLERVTPNQLNIIDGQPENVCRPCATVRPPH